MKYINELKNIFSDLNKKQKLHIFLLSILILFIFSMSLFASSLLAIIVKTPLTVLDNLSNTYNQTSYIYNEDGKLLEKIDSEEYRTNVPLEKIPTHMQKAFVGIEDHRFYTHHGLDPIGIASSILTNIKTGAFTRGGSTITQQLVRSIYLTNDKTITRKIKEAYLALRLEENLSKGEILEAYLNRINLGQGAYGIQAASQTYFSKNVWELNTAQCALLAGIAKSPREYPPYKTVPSTYLKDDDKIIGNKNVNGEEMYLVLNEKSFQRQRIILNRMYELSLIDENEYKTSLNFNTVESLKPGDLKHHTMSTYSTDYIKSEASKYLAKYYNLSLDEGEHKLFTGGYKIYASIDEDLQNNLEDLYANFTKFIKEGPQDKGSRMLNFSLDDGGSIAYKDETLYFKRYDHFDEDFNFIVTLNDYNISSKGDLKISGRFFRKIGNKIDFIDLYEINENGLLLTYDIGNLNIDSSYADLKKDYLIIDGSFIKDHDDFYRIDENQNLIINPSYTEINKDANIQPQSSALIADNESGFVKALVGGLDVSSKKAKILNRATDSHRSPGNLLKPFTVYLPALEEGYTLGSVFDDIPTTTDEYMWPENYYKSFKGLMTIRDAIGNSSNVVAASILKDIGIERSLNVLKRFNLISENPNDDYFINASENSEKNDMNLDSIALGNMEKGLSLNEASRMYASLAQGGNAPDLTSIIKIEDNTGITIIDNREKKTNVMDEKISYLLEDSLKINSSKDNAPKIGDGKTYGYLGKNRFSSDLWYVGFSKKYLVGTWLGCDSPKISLNTDDNIIIKIFNEIARDLEDSSAEEEIPSYIVKKNICRKSGKLGTKLSEDADANYDEIFIRGSEPTEYDDLYKKYLICIDSKLLSTQYCPAESVEYNVLFERKGGYDPDKHYGIYPEDYVEIPTKYCNIHTKSWYKDHQNDEEENNHKKINSKDRQKKIKKGAKK